MKYDIYSKYHGKIKLEKIIPKLVPLMEREVEKKGVSRVRHHVRAKRLELFNLFTGQRDILKTPLSPEFKSIMEISCRNYNCPYPFNLDTCDSGACFGCIYCFAVYTKSSLYTSWFDGNPWAPRFPSIEHVVKTLREVLSARGVEPRERKRSKKKWCGSITEMSALKKAAAQEIPLRWGNRSESFIYPEKQKGVAAEALKVLNEFDYPLIINTKSDLVLEEPYFSRICKLSKVAIQVSIIHCNDSVAKRLEPGAPPSSRRWEVIKTFNEVGVVALPRFEPIMAFINDDDEHLQEYADTAKECGVKFCLMDSYSYTARSDEIRKLFGVKGFDFDRMFWATSEFQILGSYIIEKASYYLKQRGIKTATFNFHTIPYNDDPTCCCLGDYFGNWYKYNLYVATDEIVSKKKLSFKEFDEKHYGEELAPEIRQRVKDVWNQKIDDPWNPTWCEGVIPIGRDEQNNIIYRFDPKKIGEGYENLIKMFGGMD